MAIEDLLVPEEIKKKKFDVESFLEPLETEKEKEFPPKQPSRIFELPKWLKPPEKFEFKPAEPSTLPSAETPKARFGLVEEFEFPGERELAPELRKTQFLEPTKVTPGPLYPSTKEVAKKWKEEERDIAVRKKLKTLIPDQLRSMGADDNTIKQILFYANPQTPTEAANLLTAGYDIDRVKNRLEELQMLYLPAGRGVDLAASYPKLTALTTNFALRLGIPEIQQGIYHYALPPGAVEGNVAQEMIDIAKISRAKEPLASNIGDMMGSLAQFYVTGEALTPLLSATIPNMAVSLFGKVSPNAMRFGKIVSSVVLGEAVGAYNELLNQIRTKGGDKIDFDEVLKKGTETAAHLAVLSVPGAFIPITDRIAIDVLRKGFATGGANMLYNYALGVRDPVQQALQFSWGFGIGAMSAYHDQRLARAYLEIFKREMRDVGFQQATQKIHQRYAKFRQLMDEWSKTPPEERNVIKTVEVTLNGQKIRIPSDTKSIQQKLDEAMRALKIRTAEGGTKIISQDASLIQQEVAKIMQMTEQITTDPTLNFTQKLNKANALLKSLQEPLGSMKINIGGIEYDMSDVRADETPGLFQRYKLYREGELMGTGGKLAKPKSETQILREFLYKEFIDPTKKFLLKDKVDLDVLANLGTETQRLTAWNKTINQYAEALGVDPKVMAEQFASQKFPTTPENVRALYLHNLEAVAPNVMATGAKIVPTGDNVTVRNVGGIPMQDVKMIEAINLIEEAAGRPTVVEGFGRVTIKTPKGDITGNIMKVIPGVWVTLQTAPGKTENVPWQNILETTEAPEEVAPKPPEKAEEEPEVEKPEKPEEPKVTEQQKKIDLLNSIREVSDKLDEIVIGGDVYRKKIVDKELMYQSDKELLSDTELVEKISGTDDETALTDEITRIREEKTLSDFTDEITKIVGEEEEEEKAEPEEKPIGEAKFKKGEVVWGSPPGTRIDHRLTIQGVNSKTIEGKTTYFYDVLYQRKDKTVEVVSMNESQLRSTRAIQKQQEAEIRTLSEEKKEELANKWDISPSKVPTAIRKRAAEFDRLTPENFIPQQHFIYEPGRYPQGTPKERGIFESVVTSTKRQFAFELLGIDDKPSWSKLARAEALDQLKEYLKTYEAERIQQEFGYLISPTGIKVHTKNFVPGAKIKDKVSGEWLTIVSYEPKTNTIIIKDGSYIDDVLPDKDYIPVAGFITAEGEELKDLRPLWDQLVPPDKEAMEDLGYTPEAVNKLSGKDEVRRIIENDIAYKEPKDIRLEAVGILSGGKVSHVEERGYEFVEGEMTEDDRITLAGMISGSYADRLKGKNITIRKIEKPTTEKLPDLTDQEQEVFEKAKRVFANIIAEAKPEELEKAKTGLGFNAANFAKRFFSEPDFSWKDHQGLYKRISNIYFSYFEELGVKEEGELAKQFPPPILPSPETRLTETPSDLRGRYDEYSEWSAKVNDEYKKQIKAIDDQITPIKSKRDKVSVAKKKELNAEKEKIKARFDEFKANYDELIVDKDIEFQNLVKQKLAEKGVSEDDADNIIVDFYEMVDHQEGEKFAKAKVSEVFDWLAKEYKIKEPKVEKKEPLPKEKVIPPINASDEEWQKFTERFTDELDKSDYHKRTEALSALRGRNKDEDANKLIGALGHLGYESENVLDISQQAERIIETFNAQKFGIGATPTEQTFDEYINQVIKTSGWESFNEEFLTPEKQKMLDEAVGQGVLITKEINGKTAYQRVKEKVYKSTKEKVTEIAKEEEKKPMEMSDEELIAWWEKEKRPETPAKSIVSLLRAPDQENRDVLLKAIKSYLDKTEAGYKEYKEKVSTVGPEIAPTFQKIIDEYETAEKIYNRETKPGIGGLLPWEVWDSLNEAERTDIATREGWTVKTGPRAGQLSNIGQKIVKSEWDQLDPAAIKLITPYINKIIAERREGDERSAEWGSLEKPNVDKLVDWIKSQFERTEFRDTNLFKELAFLLNTSEHALIKEGKLVQNLVRLALIEKTKESIKPEDPIETQLETAIRLYANMPKRVKIRVPDTIQFQQYDTPPPLALLMSYYLKLGFGTVADTDAFLVEEPTFGLGSLSIGFRNNQMYGAEIVEDRYNLIKDKYPHIEPEDFFEWVRSQPDSYFSVLTMNPPFSQTPSGKDIEATISRAQIPAERFDGYLIRGLERLMVVKALEKMMPMGKAAIVIGGWNFEDIKGVQKKLSDDDRYLFNYLYSHYKVDANIELPKDIFAPFGTLYPMRLILISGRKETPDKMRAPYLSDGEIVGGSISRVSSYKEILNTINRIRAAELGQEPTGKPKEPSKEESDIDKVLDVLKGLELRVRVPRGAKGFPTGELSDKGREKLRKVMEAIKKNPAIAKLFPPDFLNKDPDANTLKTIIETIQRRKVELQKPGRKPGRETRKGGERGTTEAGKGVGETTPGGTVTPSAERPGGGGTVTTEQPERPTTTTTEEPKPGSDVQQPGSIPTGGMVGVGGLESQVPYPPLSTENDPEAVDGELLSPPFLSLRTRKFVELIQFEKGNINEWVRSELQYPDFKALYKAFNGPQIDSIAIILYNFEKQLIAGQPLATIVGHQMGVGKGRICMAIARWGMIQGLKPVFITKDSKLMSDIIRDAYDIGLFDLMPKFKPLILHERDAVINKSDKGETILDKEPGEVIFEPTLKDLAQNDIVKDVQKYKNRYDMLFLSYYRVQRLNNAGQRILAEWIKDDMIIMDEAHETSGTSRRNIFFMDILKPFFVNAAYKPQRGAKYVMYSTGTYAKNPMNLPVYFRSLLGAIPPNVLVRAILMGGVPLEEWLADHLGAMGDLIRFEQSMEGVDEIKAVIDIANKTRDINRMDSSTSVLRDIIEFDKQFKQEMLEYFEEEIESAGGKIKIGTFVADSVNKQGFFARVHNYLSQLLLSLKIDGVADAAIEAYKKGEKPVVVLMNTMEAVTNRAAERYKKLGKDLPFSFKDVIREALISILRFTAEDEHGDKINIYIGAKKWGVDASPGLPDISEFPGLNEGFEAIMELIDKLKTDHPASPIDHYRWKLEQAGIKVGEITGRGTYVDYGATGRPELKVREETDTNRNQTIFGFQNGDLDALIYNAAGAFGISLHATDIDPRPRRLFVVQPHWDINVFLQSLFRVFRYGQKAKPAIEIWATGIPTETRILGIIMKKLRFLNANTTASAETDMTLKTIADMFNPIGNSVIRSYLRQNTWLLWLLNIDADKIGRENMITVTGKMSVQDCELQERFYDEIEAKYRAMEKHLNDIGENIHAVQNSNLMFVPQKSTKIFEGDNQTPLTADAYLYEVLANIEKKPYNRLKVHDLLLKELGIKMIEELKGELKDKYNKDVVDKIQAKADEYLENYGKEHPDRVDEMKRHVREQMKRIGDLMLHFKIGNSYIFSRSEQSMVLGPAGATTHIGFEDAVLIKIRYTPGTAGVPSALHKTELTFAVTHTYQTITLPLSQLEWVSRDRLGFRTDNGDVRWTYEISPNKPFVPENWDDNIFVTQDKQIRYIITGNLLGAFSRLKRRLPIVNVTNEKGEWIKAILVPKSAEKKILDMLRRAGMSVGPESAYHFLTTRDPEKEYKQKIVNSDDGEVKVQTNFDDDNNLESFYVTVPKPKSRGEKYYADQSLAKVIGRWFDIHGREMMSENDKKDQNALLADLKEALNLLSKIGGIRWIVPQKEESQSNPSQDLHNDIKAKQFSRAKDGSATEDMGAYHYEEPFGQTFSKPGVTSAERLDVLDLEELAGYLGETYVDEPVEKLNLWEEMAKVIRGLGLFAEHEINEMYVPRGTEGLFYPRTKNIFLKTIVDYYVGLHEITHAVDDKLGLTKLLMQPPRLDARGYPMYSDEQKLLFKHLTHLYVTYYPGGKKNHRLKKRVEEGLAVLVSYYGMQPKSMRQNFPWLVDQFLKPGGKYYQKDLVNLAYKIQSIIIKYQKLRPSQKTRARMAPKVKVERKFSTGTRFVTNVLDYQYALEEIVERQKRHHGIREWGKEKPAIVRSANNFTLWSRLYGQGNVGKIISKNIMAKKGYYQFDENGNLKRQGFKGKIDDKEYEYNWGVLLNLLHKKGILDQFEEWLLARSYVYDWKRLHNLKAEIDDLKAERDEKAKAENRIDKVLSRRIKDLLKEYEQLKHQLDRDQFPEQDAIDTYTELDHHKDPYFVEFADWFDTLVGADLDFLHSPLVRILDTYWYNKLNQREGYCTHKRFFINEFLGYPMDPKEGGTMRARGKLRISSLIKRTGGLHAYESPLFASIRNHDEITRKAIKQITYNKILDMTEANPELYGDIFQRVDYEPIMETKGNYIVARNPQFKRVGIEVNENVKTILDNVLSPRNFSTFMGILNHITRVFVRGTTGAYIFFTISNFMMDQLTAPAQSLTKMVPLLSTIKEMRKVLFDHDSPEAGFAHEWFALGGERGTMVRAFDRDEDIIKVLTNERNVLSKIFWAIDKGLDWLTIPAQYSEIATRLTEYVRMRKKGYSSIAAFEQSMRVTGPYLHKGGAPNKTTFASFFVLYPFLNFTSQVTRQLYLSFKDPKTRPAVLLTIALVATAMVSSLMWLLKKATPQQIALYKGLTPDEKARYFWIPNPNGKALLRWRVPEQIGVFGAIVNMAIEQAMVGTHYDTWDYFDAATVWLPEEVNPSQPLRMLFNWFPHVLRPIASVLIAGKYTYPRLRDIEGPAIKWKPKVEERYYPSTPWWAKEMGKLTKHFNLSPVKVQALVQGYFGRAARLYLGLPDMIGGKRVAVKPSWERDLYFHSLSNVMYFWDELNKSDNDMKSLKKNPDMFTGEERQRIYDRNAELTRIEEKVRRFGKMPEGEAADDFLIEVLDDIDSLR